MGALFAVACEASNPSWRPAVTDGAPDRPDATGAPEVPAARPDVDAAAVEDAAARDHPAPVDTSPPEDWPSGDAAADRPADAATDLPADAPVLPVPISHWRLDPTAGTTVPDDRGTNPGSLHNGPTYTDDGPVLARRNGGALVLNGTGDYASLGVRNLPTLPQEKTISLWLWVNDDFRSVQRKTALSFENLAEGISIHIGLEYGFIAVWGWASSAAQMNDVTRASLGAWHHVGYTYDGRTHVLYVGGRRVDDVTFAMKDVPPGELFLGLFHPTDGSGERWKGRIDDVRIYGRALTAAEIGALAAGH